jgi:hypothetical protein
MRRNTKDLPEGEIAGEAIMRNPGATIIWITREYRVFRPDPKKAGVLFKLGAPEHISFWREGRPATRAEVLEAINSGMPILRDLAIEQGQEAMHALQRQYHQALKLLPAA